MLLVHKGSLEVESDIVVFFFCDSKAKLVVTAAHRESDLLVRQMKAVIKHVVDLFSVDGNE